MATYTVKQGDTLSQIAQTLGVPMSSLTGYASGNPNLIRIGEVLSYGNSPVTQFLGNSANNPALAGGASGRFLDDDGNHFNDTTSQQIDSAYTYANQFGTPSSEIGNFYSDPNYRIPTLSAGESTGLASDFGLLGIGNSNRFAGMTRAEAEALAQREKEQAQSKVSQNTSFSWNQDFMNALNSSKKILNGLNLGLKDTQSPWNTEQDKTTGKNKLIENSTQEFAKLFQNPAQFDQYYNGDSEFRQIMEAFQKAGGNTEAVRNLVNRGVQAINTQQPTEVAPQVQNTPNNDRLGVTTDKEMLKGLADSTNQQIIAQYNIPSKYQEFYFGDSGYFTQMRKDAEEQLASLDARYADIKKNTLADYEANVARANAEAQMQLANIEEQRQDSKTYMTGMLAKLGALKTTGQAGATMQRIEAKYNNARTSVENALSNAKATLASGYANNITSIENELANQMSTIRNNTRDSGFQIQLKLMEVQQQAEDKIGALIADFNKNSYEVDKEALAYQNQLNLEYQKNMWDTLRMRESSALDLRNAKDLASFKAGLDFVAKQAETQTTNSNASGEAQAVVNAIDKIDPAKLFGKYNFSPFIDNTKGVFNPEQKAYLDFVINNLTLENRMKLKGQGAITDKETDMLAKAATILTNPRLTQEQAGAELARIRTIFNDKVIGGGTPTSGATSSGLKYTVEK